VPVAHTCNPSYSGGRDQEDHGLKSAMANSWQDPTSKNWSEKRAGGVAEGVGSEFKPQYGKKKKKKKKEVIRLQMD
jgi:ribosomal protein L44E